MDISKLAASISGQVFLDEETRNQVSTDFGRIVERVPAAVVVPASPQDVQATVRFALEGGHSISTRGAAHSQSGQSLSEGGILMDMSGLSSVSELQEDSVRAGGGVVWKDLVNATWARGLIPRVLTNNLNVTVGGTLSMAGLGVASHRYGGQVDNVLELEVVTGDGHLVRCSPDRNRELFDCSRSGLGQFSIITGARVQLRRAARKVRTYYLLYDDIRVLMNDQEAIIRRDRIDYIESWCVPCPQGFRTLGESRMPFAEWFYPLHLTVEFEEEPNDEEILAGLNFYRKVHQEDLGMLQFANRLEPLFELWRMGGAWNFPHPWMEVILPWQVTPGYIDGVLKSFPPNLMVGGHVLLWPCRGTTSTAPLFKHPGGEFVMGFGILPAIPRQFLPLALPMLNKASDLSVRVGGKRYLSGWLEADKFDWKGHFGESWKQVCEWKRFYDPKGILNPGFIRYE